MVAARDGVRNVKLLGRKLVCDSGVRAGLEIKA